MLLSCRTDHSPTHNPAVVFRRVIVFPSRFSSCVKDAAIMSSGFVQGEGWRYHRLAPPRSPVLLQYVLSLFTTSVILRVLGSLLLPRLQTLWSPVSLAFHTWLSG